MGCGASSSVPIDIAPESTDISPKESTGLYHGTAALRLLLTHDKTLGGVPIKLLRARWLLEHFGEDASLRATLTAAEFTRTTEKNFHRVFEVRAKDVSGGKRRVDGDESSELVPNELANPVGSTLFYYGRPVTFKGVTPNGYWVDIECGEAYKAALDEEIDVARRTLDQASPRLEYRQQLERMHPEAFASDKMVHRLLQSIDALAADSLGGSEVRSAQCPPSSESEVTCSIILPEEDWELHSHWSKCFQSLEQVTEKLPVSMRIGGLGFTSSKDEQVSNIKRGRRLAGIVACSYCWLAREHPDPLARTMRDFWLPAIEAHLMARVRHCVQLRQDLALVVGEVWEVTNTGFKRTWTAEQEAATAAEAAAFGVTVGMNDEELLDCADFALFIDFASMHQHGAGKRTKSEDLLFRRALGSLDVIYGHHDCMTFLTTTLPAGVSEGHLLGYEDRGWPTFERAVSECIKPSHACVDLGGIHLRRIQSVGEGHLLGKMIGDPASVRPAVRFQLGEAGLASILKQEVCSIDGTRRTRKPPLASADFNALLATKTFTNGADRSTVEGLYQKTMINLLSSVSDVAYTGHHWGQAEWAAFGRSLSLHTAMKTLSISDCRSMDGAAGSLHAVCPPSLRAIYFLACGLRTFSLDVSACSMLVYVSLDRIDSLTALSNLSCPGLALLAIKECKALSSIDLSGCGLRNLFVYRCESLTSITGVEENAHLEGVQLLSNQALAELPSFAHCHSLIGLEIDAGYIKRAPQLCPRITALPDLTDCHSLRVLILKGLIHFDPAGKCAQLKKLLPRLHISCDYYVLWYG